MFFKKKPTILIINSANYFGSRLVDVCLYNGAYVISVDDFTEEKLPYIRQFAKSKDYIFIDKNKFDNIFQEYERIDHVIHLFHDNNSRNDEITSKYFSENTIFFEQVMQLVTKKQSRYIITTSLHLHKDLITYRSHLNTEESYTQADLQFFLEKSVKEYYKKFKIKSTIIRFGNIIGLEIDLKSDEILHSLVRQSVMNEEIIIHGDGLEFMYYVYIDDAIRGLLKTLFIKETYGRIYTITYPEEITVLSIANKLLTFDGKAKRLRFIQDQYSQNPLFERAYIPDKNLYDLGWTPLVSFDKALFKLFCHYRDTLVREYALEPTDISRIDYNAKSEKSFIFDKHDDEVLDLSNIYFLTEEKDADEMVKLTDFQKKLNSINRPIYNRLFSENTSQISHSKDSIKSRVILSTVVVFLLLIGLLSIFVFFPFLMTYYNSSRIFASAEIISLSLQTQRLDSIEKSYYAEDVEKYTIIYSLLRENIRFLPDIEYFTKVKLYGDALDKLTVFIIDYRERNIEDLLATGRIPENKLIEIKDISVRLKTLIVNFSSLTQDTNIPLDVRDDINRIYLWLQSKDQEIDAILSQGTENNFLEGF